MIANRDGDVREAASDAYDGAWLVDPAYLNEIPFSIAKQKELEERLSARRLPWTLAVFTERNSFSSKWFIILLALGSVLVLALGLGLGLNSPERSVEELTSAAPTASEVSDTTPMFLNQHAVYYNLVGVILNLEALIVDSSLLFDVTGSSFSGNASVEVFFLAGGETIEFTVFASVPTNFGILFGDDSSGSLRIVQGQLGLSSQIKVSLPTSCHVASCSYTQVQLFAVSPDQKRRSLSKRFDFVWTCGELTCDDSTCAQFLETCSKRSLPVSAQFALCLDQFNFEMNLVQAWQQEDCFELEVLQSIAASCAAVAKFDLEETTELTHVVDDTSCSIQVPECVQLNADAFVQIKLCDLVRTHKTSSPTAIATSFAPSFKYTGAPTSQIPSLAPSKSTETPFTSAPATCNPLCSCPAIDKCCCSDGYCAPDTCPDNFGE